MGSKTNSKTKPKKKVIKKPAKRKPRKNKLVKITSPIRPDVQMFIASDLADEGMIEKEILGQALQHYIYEFTDSKGNTVRGLSLHGVRETVRLINRNPRSGSKIRISPEPPIINRDIEMNGQKGIEILVYAEDLVNGGGSWGNCFEPYVKVGKRGTYPSLFAERVALSKAQRNAQRALIPEKLATEMIAQLSADKSNVQQIEAPKEAVTVKAVEPQKPNQQALFAGSMQRVQQIKSDKNLLLKALAKVDALPLSDDNKERVKQEINGCLKSL